MDEVNTNAGTIFSFKIGEDHAKAFQSRMPGISIGDITEQDVAECVAKVHLQSKRLRTVIPDFADVDQTASIEGKMRAMNAAKQHDKRTGEGFSVALDATVVETDLVGEGVR